MKSERLGYFGWPCETYLDHLQTVVAKNTHWIQFSRATDSTTGSIEAKNPAVPCLWGSYASSLKTLPEGNTFLLSLGRLRGFTSVAAGDSLCPRPNKVNGLRAFSAISGGLRAEEASLGFGCHRVISGAWSLLRCPWGLATKFLSALNSGIDGRYRSCRLLRPLFQCWFRKGLSDWTEDFNGQTTKSYCC